MEVDFSLTQDDLAAFQQYHAEHGPASGRPRPAWSKGFLWTVAVIGLIGITLITVGSGGNLFLGVAGYFSLLGCIYAAAQVGLYLRRRGASRGIRKTFEEAQAKGLLEQQLRISPEGVTSVNKLGAALVKWPAIVTVGVTGNHVFLYTNAWSAHIVPRRAFAQEREFTAFAEAAMRCHAEALHPGRPAGATDYAAS